MVNQTQIDDELQALWDLRMKVKEEFQITRAHLETLKGQAKEIADSGSREAGHHRGAQMAFQHAIESLDILQNGVMKHFD